MILNKFRRHSFFYNLKAFSLQLLAFSLVCCNKEANSNGNKAFVNVTHTAYNTGPVTLSFDGILLFTSPLSYGQTTQNANGPYDTTTAGVQNLQIFQGSNAILSGNTALQQGTHYSLFVYDTLNQNSLKVIVFQDFQANRTDTLTYIRYLNFTPGSDIGILVIFPRDTTLPVKASYRDTVIIGPSFFVGYNPNPSLYQQPFSVHIGKNQVFAFVDSARPNAIDSSNFRYMGSFQFDSTVNYNVFLQGFADSLSGINKFQLKTFPLN
jgi:hypothetical protein